ncbi:MAG: Dabb family protein [Actinomycetia bacterium]|nr:Dabb family protein [Actinomycetes bacterium]
MIRHVVLLKWNEGVAAAHITATKAALDRLPGLIPQIVSYQNGPDLHVAPTNYDYAVTAEFESADDFIVYRDHPAHQEVVQSYLAPHSQRFAVQFSVD